MRLDVTFEQLLTKALDSNQPNPQFLTRIPKCLLNDTQKGYVKFVEDALKSQFVPTVETLRSKMRFLPQKSEIPLDVLYENFTEQARETFLAESMAEKVRQNREKNQDPYMGMTEYLKNLLDTTAIPHHDIIEYNNYPRELCQQNIYRSSFNLPYFDEFTNGLNGGDFIVLYAATKGYKTTLLKALTIGTLANTETHENVMFCSQEQGPLKMLLQLDMFALNKPHNNLRSGIDEEAMGGLKNVESAFAPMENRVFITPAVKSVAQLHEYIVSQGVPIHKIFIDGLNLMATGADSYTSLMEVCRELKDYAEKHNIVVIVVTQANREGYKAGSGMSVEHVAGSFGIAMYCDLMLGLSFQKEKEEFVYIKPLLNRHGHLRHRVLMFPKYTDNSFTIEFDTPKDGIVPEDVKLTDNLKGRVKSNFKDLTGMTYEESVRTHGIDVTNAVLEMTAINESGEF